MTSEQVMEVFRVVYQTGKPDSDVGFEGLTWLHFDIDLKLNGVDVVVVRFVDSNGPNRL